MATNRPRSAKASFEIHHDEMVGNDSLEEQNHGMEESRAETEEDEEQNDDAESYYSDATDEMVDAAVAEDMQKFQETFKGIKDRFRLINRIGEGRCLPSFTNSMN
jgi:cell division control protein 7